MILPDKFLKVKTSTLPRAGKGLFVNIDVPKGGLITEYLGHRTNWAAVEDDVDNGYIYHINDDHVIDASRDLNSFGRYANDAAGFSRVPGLRNNAIYEEQGTRVFIKATRHIAAGSEVFVAYGRAYWRQARQNYKIDQSAAKKPRR